MLEVTYARMLIDLLRFHSMHVGLKRYAKCRRQTAVSCFTHPESRAEHIRHTYTAVLSQPKQTSAACYVPSKKPAMLAAIAEAPLRDRWSGPGPQRERRHWISVPRIGVKSMGFVRNPRET